MGNLFRPAADAGTSNVQSLLAARVPKNTVLRDAVNDQQVLLAKRAPQMIKNPKKLTNEERGSLLGGK